MRNYPLPGCLAALGLVSTLLSANALAQQSVSAESEAKDLPFVLAESPVERQPIPDWERPGIVRRSIIVVDDAQRIASERFGNFMGQVDGFFSNAGSDDDAVSNGSWARIRLDGVRENNEDFELDPSVKIRAVLPETERKLKLLVSTEDDDSQEVGQARPQAAQNDQNASLALRFIRTARESGDVNLDIGVRQRDGDIQYFGRLNTRFTLDLGDHWIANAANSYWYYNKSGFENTLSFDLRRLLFDKDNLFFRTFTNFNWEKGRKGAVIGHTSGFYWQFGPRRSLALEGLAGYHTALNTGVSDRFQGHQIRLRWRHNVWRPWFFYEVWPSVAWPSSTEYRQANGILMRLEVIIGQTD